MAFFQIVILPSEPSWKKSLYIDSDSFFALDISQRNDSLGAHVADTQGAPPFMDGVGICGNTDSHQDTPKLAVSIGVSDIGIIFTIV